MITINSFYEILLQQPVIVLWKKIQRLVLCSMTRVHTRGFSKSRKPVKTFFFYFEWKYDLPRNFDEIRLIKSRIEVSWVINSSTLDLTMLKVHIFNANVVSRENSYSRNNVFLKLFDMRYHFRNFQETGIKILLS